jgi:hypothetical protein
MCALRRIRHEPGDQGVAHQNQLTHSQYKNQQMQLVKYSMFNLKVDRQLSREYFTSDAIYNGSAGMTLYYYMCRSWQDCRRRGENRSFDRECWCLNNAIFYAFIMRLTVEERVFILKSYLKIYKADASKKSYCEND